MKIAMLLSGGVDSSVALRLLKDEGHDITAYYLKIWLQEEFSFLGDCPWEEDLQYCRAVCSQADVALEILPLQTEYWDSIIKYTIDEIKSGRTPNPDMFCNNLVKFGIFCDRIDPSFEKVASGHYAKVYQTENRYVLERTPDAVKDQTYFLAYLNQQQLARACFPLGNYTKRQVRDLARKYNLPTQNRRDSQGLCFLGQIKFSEFVKQHLGEKKGDIIELDSGEKLAEHSGYYYYTIGQRQGLGLSGGPWYVVKKDIPNNRIYVSRRMDMENKYRDEFRAGNFNWISGEKPAKENLQVKVRHGENIYNCSLKFIDEDSAGVKLDRADRPGIAAGQFAVFYDGAVCLGGGVILE
jgi:tRNA-specific 2-thiouridylase